MEDQDLVQEEKVRKAAVRKSKMESGLMAEDADQQEKKAVSKDKSIIYIHYEFISSLFIDGYS